MSNTKFLTSGVNVENLATETTLTHLSDFLEAGALETTTNINFPPSIDVTLKDVDFTTTQTNNMNVTLDDIAGNFKNNDDTLNINIRRINAKASGFFNTGPATDGTLKVVLSDDYLSTTKNQINDVNITAQTTDLNVNVTNASLTNIDTNTSTISSQLPATLGGKTAANSLSVTLSTDEPIVDVGIDTANQTGNLRTTEQDTNFSGAMNNLANNFNTLATESTVSTISAQLPTTLGGKTGGNSLSVTLSTDEPVIDVGIDTANQTGNLRVSEQDTNFSGAMDNLANNFDTLVTETTGANIQANTFNTYTRLPATLGQKAEAASLATVLSNDYTSTLTNRYSLENDYFYHRSPFLLNASVNMAQNLGGDADTTISLIGDIIYLDKIVVYIRFGSGTADVSGWGTAGSALGSGWHLRFGTNFTHITNLANNVTTNGDLIYYFDETTYYSFGTGTALRGVFNLRPYKLKLDTTNTGTIYYDFPTVDLSDGGNIARFESSLYYYSDSSS